MNIKEYITSGIVESYVLGLASAAERAEFENMCHNHPEVTAARDAFENSLENFSLQNTVTPPAGVRDKVFNQIQAVSRSVDTGNGPAPVVRLANRQRYVAAAAIILLVASTALNFYFFSQYKAFSARYEDLLSRNTDLAKNEQVLQTRLRDYESAFQMLKSPDMAVIKMMGSQVPASPAPSSAATIYWDTRTKDVYLVVNNMPSPATGKQYQLWAIVDSKPVDAGVFDISDSSMVVKMKNIPRAEAFAVTLENRGGSIAPTMDQMYVMGKPS